MSDLKSNNIGSASNDILKLAIFAVGGQGGGVLSNWIVDLAERNGYDVQATSVAGVAQRTGATIYYVEMLPLSDKRPVFALAPTEGDVDILVAAELMEAGRAITRGYVLPDQTTVIVSTHRQLATVEKVVPGNGIADSEKVLEAIQAHANKVVAFDMQCIAEAEGTVISAALFGALAGSHVLPFSIDSYRDTVTASGRGVQKSLAAFEAALIVATAGNTLPAVAVEMNKATQKPLTGTGDMQSAFNVLEGRIDDLPSPIQDTALAGIKKVADFQDVAYAEQYLTLIEQLCVDDCNASGAKYNFVYSINGAKHLANAMCYDDIIHVADAKTRFGRAGRIAAEVGATEEHLTQITEYTHPGAAEVVSVLPRFLALWIERRVGLVRVIDKLVNRGRHIRTDRLPGFLSFFVLAGLRPWRRRLLRHSREWAHIDAWLQLARERLDDNYHFAAETLNVRRLIKGYSDTHARGLSKFDQVIAGTRVLEHATDASDRTKQLIDAALADADGQLLEAELDKIQALVTSPSTTAA